MEMLGGDPWPKLRGRAAKIKHFSKPLLAVFTRHMDRANQQHREIEMCLRASIKIEANVDMHRGEFKLPSEPAKDFLASAFQFTTCNNSLGKFFHPKHVQLFPSTWKYHYLLHCAIRSKWVNPDLGWCYGGESFLKNIRKLAHASSFGLEAEIIPNRVVSKYATGLTLEFHKDLESNKPFLLKDR